MRNIYIGDEGVAVEYLQLALKRAGFPIMVDGQFGGETCNALKEFMGEGVSCYVDRAAWAKLIPYLKGYTTHVIAAGETLWGIADTYDTQVSAILTANPSLDAMNLQIGTRIYVPFSFALVDENVPYTSSLTEFILEGLKIRYPFLISGCIGKSVMGREVCYLQFGEGPTQVCYNACFHANEWITTPILLKFAEAYAKAYAEGEDLYGEDTEMLFNDFSLYLIPMVNPDGADLVNGMIRNEEYVEQTMAISSDYPSIPYPDGWKANINGIDLNLQFPAGWEIARENKFSQGFTSPAPRDFVGEAPLSAIESINMYHFTTAHDFQLILAYHTQGEVIYWKYLDYEPERSRRIAEYFSRVSGYLVEDTPYASGYAGYKDWFIKAYNRPGYTIEAGRGTNPLNMSQFPKIYADNRLILA
ncbi:MAG: LysM peptidoglycan-binding domain-containing protein, partial [Lachnospiraceae bacterium]|nr:LysM peptidoglycan-binding domain-containing protein [Lachnospiraceae bacterium]